MSTTAKPPAPSLPASLVDLLGEPESAPEPLGGGSLGTFGDLLIGARRIQAAIDPAHPELSLIHI